MPIAVSGCVVRPTRARHARKPGVRPTQARALRWRPCADCWESSARPRGARKAWRAPPLARPGSPIESAVYDEDSRMLLGFLNGLTAHLVPGGEGWLILSDFAEHLGLRSRADLLAAFERGGLKVAGRIDARPRHPKAADASDPLHDARAAEVTSLWRLAAA